MLSVSLFKCFLSQKWLPLLMRVSNEAGIQVPDRLWGRSEDRKPRAPLPAAGSLAESLDGKSVRESLPSSCPVLGLSMREGEGQK